MLDVNLMDVVLRRGEAVAPQVAQYRELDSRRKALQGKLDELRARRNAANDEMARLDKKSAQFTAAREGLKELSIAIKQGESELNEVEDRCLDLLLHIPNAPHVSVPDGKDESHNRLEHVW